MAEKNDKIIVWLVPVYVAVLAILCLTIFRIDMIPNSVREKRLFPGDAIDSIDGVYVYYNGSRNNAYGLHITPEGYYLGRKYQSDEFVRRYYLKRYKHKMSDHYRRISDLFDTTVRDGGFNQLTGLRQYNNPSTMQPQRGDIVIFGATFFDSQGMVGIISEVNEDHVEIVMQNNIDSSDTRIDIELLYVDGKWLIEEDWAVLLGWLRKE